MKRAYFIWLGSAAAVLILAALAWFTLRQRGEAFQVFTANVTRGSIARRIIVAGTLQPVKSVDVGAQVSGTIQSLAVDFNSMVKKGQVLARLDPALFQAALDNARAMYEKAVADADGFRVAVDDAQTKLTRAKELAAKQLIPQSDLDAAEIALKEAQADLQSGLAAANRAKGTVNQAETDLAHTVITAPADGIIVNRSVDVGQTVAASYQTPVLFRIAASIENMQVQADVDEADIASVQPGVPVTFIVESYPTDTFTGTVSLVRPQPGSATTSTGAGGGPNTQATPGQGSATAGVTYMTLIDVRNPDHKLRPGMTATVYIVGSQRKDTVRIPNQALLFRPSIDLLKAVGQHAPNELREGGSEEELQQVWKWDGKHFTAVDVTLGISDAQWTEQVRGALKDGDPLVINTSFRSAIKK
jgi:HlyD family secretion protein